MTTPRAGSYVVCAMTAPTGFALPSTPCRNITVGWSEKREVRFSFDLAHVSPLSGAGLGRR
jgi:hypothetical protein